MFSKDKKAKKIVELPDKGKFINKRDDEQLQKLQKLKTIFMLLSTLFFAVSLFLPVVGRIHISDILWANTLYILLDIALIIISVFVSYQGFKKHRISKEVSFYDSPRYGYKPLTYIAFELFTFMHILYLAIEVALLVLAVEVWGILNAISALISAAFAVTARQLLYIANAKHMEFIPPIMPDIIPDDDDSEHNDIESSGNAENEKSAEEQCDDTLDSENDADI